MTMRLSINQCWSRSAATQRWWNSQVYGTNTSRQLMQRLQSGQRHLYSSSSQSQHQPAKSIPAETLQSHGHNAPTSASASASMSTAAFTTVTPNQTPVPPAAPPHFVPTSVSSSSSGSASSTQTPQTPQSAPSSSLKTIASYTKAFVYTHVALTSLTVLGFYYLLKEHVDIVGYLQSYGFHVDQENNIYTSNAGMAEDADSTVPEWEMSEEAFRKAMEDSSAQSDKQDVGREQVVKEDTTVPVPKLGLYGGGSVLAIAYMCSSAVWMLRLPTSLALTPIVRRFLFKRRKAV